MSGVAQWVSGLSGAQWGSGFAIALVPETEAYRETRDSSSHAVDGVVYVVDPGVSKQKEYDPKSGMDSLSVRPISRVQATQR